MIVQAKVRLEINPDKAKALGLRFCAERNARQLSPQDIADALLLSKLQVNGLETANHQSFLQRQNVRPGSRQIRPIPRL